MTENPAAATALWCVGGGKAELRRTELPRAGGGEVLVRTLHSGISRGTEALVFAGRVPDSERTRMRAPFQDGDFPFPVKYGYAAVGVVEAGPEDLRGRAVFCLHPHQDRFVVPAAAVTPLPAGLPPARAVLAANMETAVNVVWDAGIAPGDRVAVVGAGVVGALVAHLAARIPGTEVTLVDRLESRASLATRLGCRFAQPDDAAAGLGEACDVVVHASASAAGLATAIGLAGFEAVVVEASWHGAGPVAVDLGGAFHSRRLRLVSSQVGHLPASRRGRWDFARRLALALDLLGDDRLDALISGETAFADLAAAYPAILADAGTLCHRVRYDEGTAAASAP
ncbi:zinc-dependent alcohol dehydrogenase [Methylobrevis albus]|uniref:Zinc-binding alcohol dehydrogenase n=1 Tax=Methylobrevis albus TaxID=2793297 RepID=A0A931I0H7_9HYPH|nr:zinc-binding alcohol dehydrogenase [Methylobrevis albus]MBH0237900.1 zinc-binding alcohol dehydrogenase [Methylobrevis albus]